MNLPLRLSYSFHPFYNYSTMDYSENEKLKLQDVSYFAANEYLPNPNNSMMANSPSPKRRTIAINDPKENKINQFENDLRLFDLTENYSGKS